MLTGKMIGKLNLSASIYRSIYAPAPSLYRSLSTQAMSISTSSQLNTGVSASPLAADFTSSAYKAETSPMILRRGLNSSLSIYQYRSSFSSSAPVNAAAAELTVDDALLDDDMIAKAYKTVTTQKVLQPGVIVYDGVCHLCHNGVKWVIKADKYRNLKFCCLQSKAAEPYMDLCGVDRDDVLRRFIFIEGFGLYHQGSAAALRVLAHLPFPYSALSNLMIVPAPLRDAVYDHVAKKRYNCFGKSDDCLVLREQELLARFIDREELLERSRRVL